MGACCNKAESRGPIKPTKDKLKRPPIELEKPAMIVEPPKPEPVEKEEPVREVVEKVEVEEV